MLDCGLRAQQLKHLSRLSSTRMPNLELRVAPFKHAGTFARNRKMSGSSAPYARVMLARLLADESRAIYLDVDTCVCSALGPLWRTDLAGCTAGAVVDPFIKVRANDQPHSVILTEEERSAPYFNSGVMLIDLDAWRARNVEAKILEHLDRHAGAMRFCDQTSLNQVLCGDIHWLDERYNFLVRHGRWQPAMTILHFVDNPKPWEVANFHACYRPWYRVWVRWHLGHAATWWVVPWWNPLHFWLRPIFRNYVLGSKPFVSVCQLLMRLGLLRWIGLSEQKITSYTSLRR